MEMKYLTEQDTGKIYMPRVHITGIVDLDVSGNTSVKTVNINFTDGSIGIAHGVLEFNEYNKVVVANMILQIDTTNTGDISIYPLLLNGTTFSLNINDPSLDKYTFMIFDTVSFNSKLQIESRVDTAVSYSDGVLMIRSSLKDRNYYYNDALALTETPNNLSVYRILGTAIGFTIGGK